VPSGVVPIKSGWNPAVHLRHGRFVEFGWGVGLDPSMEGVRGQNFPISLDPPRC
jgi:hypothetical protein